MSVVDFEKARAEREEGGPHISGPAKCLKCDHEWVVVMPFNDEDGTSGDPECPACHCDGVFLGNVEKGGYHFQCGCGCMVFRIHENGPYCVNCGKDVTFEEMP